MRENNAGALREMLRQNKAVLCIIALGVALLLLPSAPASKTSREESVSFATEENRLAAVLSQIEGAGECSVLLRGESGEERGGAVIVCRGADSAAVRLSVTRAVSAYTGLGSDRIIILKSKQGGT